MNQLKTLLETFLTDFDNLVKSLISNVGNVTVKSLTFKERMLKDLAASNLQGIPAAFILTVALLETGDGIESHLSQTNNPFNIHALGNEPYTLVGQEHIRNFSSFKQAIDEFVSLMNQPRYSNALAAAQAENPQGFFQGLQAGGYAANPNYANSLMQVFNGLS